MNKWGGIWPALCVIPLLLLFILFTLIPAVINVTFSFTDFSGILGKPIHFIGLDNYRRAFILFNKDIWKAIIHTLQFSVTVTVVQNIVALFAAVLVNNDLKLKNFYRAAIFMPQVLGIVVIGFIWTLILDPITGPVNKILTVLFGIDSALLGDIHLAMWLVIFVMIWAGYGYMMVLYLAGLQRVPRELYESAMLDGAGSWAQFRYITMPLIHPVITINIVISIISTLGAYDLIVIMTGGGPLDATMTLAMYIFKQLGTASMANGRTNMGYVAALSMIQFVIVLTVVLATRKLMSRKEDDLS